jgi:hypothetical protein
MVRNCLPLVQTLEDHRARLAASRDTYARHGFTEEGGAWVYNGGSPIEEPDWLTVDAETEACRKIRL